MIDTTRTTGATKWHGRARALAIGTALLVGLAACQTELYGRLTEREANEIISVLDAYGISASKRAVGRDGHIEVLVDDARFGEAVAILNARGLPRESFSSIGDVFDGSRLVTSPTEERARLMYALSQELSRTVAAMDGVLSARVHVVLPETDPLNREVRASSASVFIKRERDAAVGNFIPQVKMLVANSIEGLSYEHVSVIDMPVASPTPLPERQMGTRDPSAAVAFGINFARIPPLMLGLAGALIGVLVTAVLVGIALWVRGRPKPMAEPPAPRQDGSVVAWSEAAERRSAPVAGGSRS